VRRRRFVGLAGGMMLAWPLAAQVQSERVRRVGMLFSVAENDASQLPRNAAFRDRLQVLGWTEERNLRLDLRWSAGDVSLFQRFAAELVALAPDVIVAMGIGSLRALRERTSTIPIVFQLVADPVGQGIVQSLARPGGHITGFTNFDFAMGGKWVEILKDLAPGITRVLFIPHRETPAGWVSPVTTAARALSLDLIVVTINDLTELAAALDQFVRSGGGGIVIPPSSFIPVNKGEVVRLVTGTGLPAVYYSNVLPEAGGLISYGPDFVDLFRRGGDVVDRILRGADPAEMPVQNPLKFETVVNLKTARALGLTIPPSLLTFADEVIE
jgi:putative ABC transport system substrate-binding protein